MVLPVGMVTQQSHEQKSLGSLYCFCARGLQTFEHLQFFVVSRLQISQSLFLATPTLLLFSHIWLLLVYGVLRDADAVSL